MSAPFHQPDLGPSSCCSVTTYRQQQALHYGLFLGERHDCRFCWVRAKPYHPFGSPKKQAHRATKKVKAAVPNQSTCVHGHMCCACRLAPALKAKATSSQGNKTRPSSCTHANGMPGQTYVATEGVLGYIHAH